MDFQIGRLHATIGKLYSLSGHPWGITIFLRKPGMKPGEHPRDRFSPWTSWEWTWIWRDRMPRDGWHVPEIVEVWGAPRPYYGPELLPEEMAYLKKQGLTS